MDKFVEETLTNWGFEDLKEIFDSNKIDEEVFRDLNVEDIKELIPTLGLRKKFVAKYEKLNVLNEALSHEIEILDSDTISVNSCTSSANSCTSSVNSCTDSMVGDGIVIPLQYYSNKASIGLPYQILPIPDNKNSVKALLDSCEEGKLIYASYGKDKKFLRGELARLIVKNELKESREERISTERFKRLAIEINDIFLHESPDVYYTPYVSRKDLKKTVVSARGKLWSAYVTIRRKQRKYGLNCSSIAENETESTSVISDFSLESEEYIIWLKNNLEPFPQVLDYWSKTFFKRTEHLLHISEYFETYPALNHPLGYLLLESDFDHIYPDKKNLFLIKFSRIVPHIFKILKSKNDIYIKERLKALYSKNTEPSSDEVTLFTLRLLPVILQTPLKSKGPNRWKPSKIELEDGFILHVNDIADIQPALERRSSKYFSLKLTAQPIPITVGFDDITSYVSINKVLYRIETPLKAVELCFKVFHAINAHYPYEVEACWMFIQKFVYDLKTKFDKNFTSVNTLISDINCAMDSSNILDG